MDLNTQQQNNKRLKILVQLDVYKNLFRSQPRKEFLENLAIHLEPKFSTHQVKALLEKACETLEHFPSISQIHDIASQLGFSQNATWKHLEIADCTRCGGCGWFFISGPEQRLATRACDECEAGKTLQRAPKGIISEHRIPQNWFYSHAGRINS